MVQVKMNGGNRAVEKSQMNAECLKSTDRRSNHIFKTDRLHCYLQVKLDICVITSITNLSGWVADNLFHRLSMGRGLVCCPPYRSASLMHRCWAFTDAVTDDDWLYIGKKMKRWLTL